MSESMFDATDLIEVMRKQLTGDCTDIRKEIGYVVSPDNGVAEIQIILQTDKDKFLGSM